MRTVRRDSFWDSFLVSFFAKAVVAKYERDSTLSGFGLEWLNLELELHPASPPFSSSRSALASSNSSIHSVSLLCRSSLSGRHYVPKFEQKKS